MENVYDALVMAASVLLLIIALTVSISSFSSLKLEADEIVKADSTFDLVADETGSYLNYIRKSSDVRTVNIETVISSLRRIEKEQYTVYIVFKGGNIPNSNNAILKQVIVDSKTTQTYNNGAETITLVQSGAKVLEFTLKGSGYKYINDELMEQLYKAIKNKTFKEYIGEYQEKTAEGVDTVNKRTFRVITFVEN